MSVAADLGRYTYVKIKSIPGGYENQMKVKNFGGLVLGWMDSYDSEKRRILQHFSRSTRFALLCTAQISKFQQKTRPKFCYNEMKWTKFHFIFGKNLWILRFFCKILTNFCRNFTRNCRKLQIFYRFWKNLPEKSGKMPDVSGNCADFIRRFHISQSYP